MAPAQERKAKKPLYKDLFFQVIVAILLGVAVGYCFPDTKLPDGSMTAGFASKMKPLGDAFINLIKMMIAPLIFCTIVSGIAGMGSMKQAGRVGAKAVLCFEIITTLALVIGLVLVEITKPGSAMNIDVTHVDLSGIKGKTDSVMPGFTEFFMNVIPKTILSAFTGDEILQVLLVAIFFAVSLPALGEKPRAQVLGVIDTLSHILFRMVDLITRLAPIGAFGAMAYTVGKFGLGALEQLGQLVAIFYLTCGVFIFAVMGTAMRFYCRLSTLKFLRFIREELLIVLGTSSSESVLPRIMEKLEALGCAKPVVGMVIPTGYSFNLVGSSIYFTMGALFITYATHTPITFWQEITLLGVLLLTSKGAAGVSGSAFIVLAATMGSMHLMPKADLDVGLALIFAVDRFMSTGRAITNLVGNGITTIVVAKWENALDYAQAKSRLDKGPALAAPENEKQVKPVLVKKVAYEQ